jgi:type IV pilus assembly protein PilB
MDADTSAVYHLLLDNGIATEGQLDEVCEEHARTGKSFVQAVYNFGIISEEDLLQMIAEHLATEVVDLTEVELPARIREKVSASLARMYGIIPVREEDGALVIAAKDPLNYRMLDELHYVLGQECRIVVAQPKQLDEALDLIYPEQVESVADVLNELASAGMDTFGADQDLNDEDALKEMATNAPIVRFVDIVLYQAIKDQASDIHFEPFADEFRIRYRIDGTLYEMAPPPKHLSVPVISRIKVMSGLNIAERRHPQDGRIEMRIAGKLIDLRVSTLPTQYGEPGQARHRRGHPQGAARDHSSSERHRDRDRAHGLRQDHDPVQLPQGSQRHRRETADGRGPGRVRPGGDHAAPGPGRHRQHVRERPARVPAPGPGPDHGR